MAFIYGLQLQFWLGKCARKKPREIKNQRNQFHEHFFFIYFAWKFHISKVVILRYNRNFETHEVDSFHFPIFWALDFLQNFWPTLKFAVVI